MRAKNVLIGRGLWLFAAIAILLVSAAVLGQQGRKIDDTALMNAGKDKEEWISYNRDWSETRFSPLDQITTANVNKLGLAWSLDIPNVGTGTRQEATNLVSNGVLYSITPYSLVYAVDVRTGKILWQTDPQASRSSAACCGVVNRGLALYEGKVIAPVLDGRLRALDMKTGELLWETRVTPTNLPYTITMAPRVIKGGRIIVGASGGEYAVRGFFSAFDATTGKELWKFYTVPGDPSKPFEQPVYADWAKTWDVSKKWWVAGGGGPVWGGVAYDPDEDLVYVGTGQPGPWTSFSRGTGDNLCTDCIIAVKGATGKYVWHYQTTPGDDWDYDSIADITLADLTINGTARKVLMHAPKNGFVFVIDRINGKFISAEPWVTVNWTSGIDPKTGRANVNPAARYGATASVNVTPGPGGGHVWVPWSFSPTTKLLYIPSTSGQRGYTFQADPNYVIATAELEEGARGRMQMGTGGGGGGGARGGGGAAGGGGARGGGGAPPAAAPGIAPGLDPTAVAQQGGAAAGGAPRGAAPGGGAPGGGAPGGGGGAGRGGGGGGAQAAAAPPNCMLSNAPANAGRGGGGGAPAAAQEGLPFIGPSANGNILVAWNPVTQKEAWRGPTGSAAGFNQGGTLATAGNLVFASVTNCLLAFRADTGEQVLGLATGFPQYPGPPMTFMLDGKQYIAVAGALPAAPGGGGGGRGGGGGGAAATPAANAPQPPAARLLMLVLDGKPVTQ